MRLLPLLALSFPLLARDLPIRIFTTNDGLVHNRVHRIVADSRGLLWMCTGGGLSRFDGSQFQSFGLAEGLPFPAVNDMLEIPGGDFWLATNGGGVVRFALSDTPRFESFSVSSDLNTNRVNFLYRAPDGVIWAGTDGGAFRMTLDAHRHPTFERVRLRLAGHPEETVQVWAALTGPDGSLWIGTRYGLVRLLGGGRVIHYPIRPGGETDVVNSVQYFGDQGGLWLGHEDGLVVFQPPPASTDTVAATGDALVDPVIARTVVRRGINPLTAPAILPRHPGEASYFDFSPFVNSHLAGHIQRFQSGVILVFMSDALLQFENGRFALINDPRIITSAQGSGAEDREGNIWVSSRAGALRIARHGFVTYREPDGLGRQVGAVFGDRSGAVVAVSQNWKVSRFDGAAVRTVELKVPPPAQRVGWRGDQDALEDRDGDWWFATRAGLLRYSGITRFEDLATRVPRLYTSRDGIAQDSVLRIFQDSRGDLWLGSLVTGHDVLTRWDRATGTFHRYSDADGLPPFNSPSSFYEDARGAVWIGFRDGGLARYTAGRFTVFTEKSGLPSGNISNMLPDGGAGLWFTNRSDLYRIPDLTGDPLSPVLVAGPRDLRGAAVSRAARDSAGIIYAITGSGTFRLNPQTGHVSALYTTSEGLADTDVYATYADPRGNLWFATAQGLSMLPPSSGELRQPVPVRIGGVRIAGQEHSVSPIGEESIAGLELQPGASQLEIDYFAIGFAAANAPQFEFRLFGADDRWSSPAPLHSVRWANMTPGTYEFQVRAVSGSGDRSPQPARVAFRVLPPVWRRGWFLALAAFAAIAALGVFERYRSRARRAVAESEVRYRTLAETASDVIVTIDESGVMTYVNAAVEGVFGHSPAELIGRELTVLMPERLREHHSRGLARYCSTGQRRLSWKAIELPGLCKDGREIPLEVAFGEFRRDGRHYFTGTIRDISERKHAEEKLVKAREERYAELERVRKRIAADLHDEIGSSLTQISILSEVAQSRGTAADPVLSHSLSTIAGASRELVDSMSDIVWAINPAKDHLSDLTQRMRRVASDSFTASNTAFHFDMPHEADHLQLGANVRRELFLIFKEGVNNMVKHSACTEATIRLHVNADTLRLELIDNGKGFDLSQPSEGHGLTSLRSRASALGGTLTIVSEPGSGSTIAFHLPLTSYKLS